MQTIPLQDLLYMLLPLGVVAYFYYRWVNNKQEILFATVRMSMQLIAIGYVLTSLFDSNSPWLLAFLVCMMIGVASLIVRRNIRHKDFRTYAMILLSIFIGGTFNLLWVLFLVLKLDTLLEPRFVIPLAGMIYANAMNAISLAAERFEKERLRHDFVKARAIAFKASMIPQINQFLAVGFVSLPGMMTGQILSGVDPLIAVRYQIVVMGMILSSGAMSNILYLSSLKEVDFTENSQ